MEYDVVGFDADHCLVNYNRSNLTELVVECILNDLSERFAYPKVKFDFKSENDIIMLNCVVWDIQHGTLLSLSEDKKITNAVCGF